MKRAWYPHPWLLGTYGPLATFAANVRSLGADPIDFLIRPLVITAALVSLVWLLWRAVLGDSRRAALVTTLSIFAVFDYLIPFSRLAAVHLVWSLLLIGGAVALAIGILRHDAKVRNLTRLLNVVAITLVGTSIAVAAVRWPSDWTNHMEPLAAAVSPAEDTVSRRPHIFYIVLDGYGRSDVLDELYDYDNSQFLQELELRGFRIAQGSRANYSLTPACLASTLNLAYIDSDLISFHGQETNNRRPLVRLINENRVTRFLQSRGYRTVSFSSGSVVTEFFPADVTIRSARFPTEFEQMLISQTSIPHLVRFLRRFPRTLAVPDQAALHRQMIRFGMDHLADLAGAEFPHFVFLHLMAPHAPFVFEQDGSPAPLKPPTFYLWDGAGTISHEDYIAGYRAQASFVSREILTAIDEVLAAARTPPIIILQGDHGPGANLQWLETDFSDAVALTDMWERLSILNAYHLPDGGSAGIYDDISPVNTFRVVLNRYFGAQLPLLEDRSYFCTWKHPLHYVDVTDRAIRGRDSIESASHGCDCR